MDANGDEMHVSNKAEGKNNAYSHISITISLKDGR